MADKRIALVTGANQGVGLQVAKELVANGVTVLVGARNFERGEAAAREIGAGAIALQLDVTDRVSIADAAARIPEGIWPPRPVGSERRYLEYEKGQLIPSGVREDNAPEQRIARRSTRCVGDQRIWDPRRSPGDAAAPQ